MVCKKLIFLSAFSLALISCSNKDSSSGSSASSSTVTTFPTSFALSSPTSVASAFYSNLENQNEAFTTETVSASAPISDKVDKLKTILSAASSSDCAIQINTISSGNATCYGPTMSFSNHPDGMSPTSLPGGDLGIWTATNTGGEACAAAQLNSRMKGVVSYVDLGLFTMASVNCVLKSESKSLPAAGASVDLTTSMSGKVTINGSAATVTNASISRSATDSDGMPVYTTSITATQSSNLTYNLRLKHIPLDSSNDTYKGKISIDVANTTGTRDGNCQNSGTPGTMEAASVSYEKSSTSNVKILLKSAGFCTATADPYVSSTDKTVDLTKVSSVSVVGWGGNANYVLAEYDPTVGTGTFYYAWQAGKGDSNARIFDSIITGSEGSRTGTSYFGFGAAITSPSFAGKIDRMICNWAGPSNNHTGVSKVQKQIFSESGGMFTPTSSLIVYDPTNSCSSSSNTFSMTVNGTTITADNTTTDLANFSDVATVITSDPVSPTNVD